MITPMSPTIVATQRVQAAGMRAIESHSRVRRLAVKLGEEMDDLTGPTVVGRAPSQGDFYDEEDSLVAVIVDGIAAVAK